MRDHPEPAGAPDAPSKPSFTDAVGDCLPAPPALREASAAGDRAWPGILSLAAGMLAWLPPSPAIAAEATPRAFAPAPGRLAHWSFNPPDGAPDESGFVSEDGRAPSLIRGLRVVKSLDGSAASFGKTNQVSLLQYPAVDPGGRTNLTWPVGSIRLLFRPEWSGRLPAAGPQYAWGRGPTQWARLFTVMGTAGGSPAPLLTLSVDPDGTNLVVEARGADGSFRTNFNAAIRWLKPQPELFPGLPFPWHEVALAWSPTNTVVLVDGVQIQDWSNQRWVGPGVGQPAGPASTWSFTLGTDAKGDWPVNGILDEVETYDRTISALDLYQLRESAVLSAAVSLSPPGVTLRWFGLSGNPVPVRRRLLGETNWITLTNRLVSFSFADRDSELRIGETYEYEVGARSAVVSLQGRPVERRGRAILLVEQSVARPLAAELEQLRADLVGDGWRVLRHDVPRHDDNDWTREAINSRYIADVQRIKSLIQADYAAAPAETKAVFIVGHAAIPYSGVAYEDGHWEMNGAWPADSFYGDMDGTWSDHVMNTGTNLASPIRRNLAGDGKFDPAVFDHYITTPSGQHGVEVAVGRIDFVRMPAFQPETEVELLRRYLRKDHRYRQKEMRFDQTACGGTFFWSPYSSIGRGIHLNALWTATRLDSLAGLAHGDVFQSPRASLWAMQGGFGGGDTLHSSPEAAAAQKIRPVTTALLAANQNEPRVGFYILKASYFGDWNGSRNDLIRGLLATPNYGLASCWTMENIWRFETLAAGDTLGSGFVRTARGQASTRTTFLLGDPTLRAQVSAPPTRATGRNRGDLVELRWEASPDAANGYLVYRSTQGADGPHELLTVAPVTETAFSDLEPPTGRKLYQVRAAQLLVTGTGSFTNLSQAAFVTVN